MYILVSAPGSDKSNSALNDVEESLFITSARLVIVSDKMPLVGTIGWLTRGSVEVIGCDAET